VNGWRSFNSKLTLACVVGRAISSGVKPHPLVSGDALTESDPLLLICQIGQISDGITLLYLRGILMLGLGLGCCWLPRNIHVALHRLGQLWIHFVRNDHDVRQQQVEIQHG
jgi:hypothetical protein